MPSRLARNRSSSQPCYVCGRLHTNREGEEDLYSDSLESNYVRNARISQGYFLFLTYGILLFLQVTSYCHLIVLCKIYHDVVKYRP